jgi:hypothetical protein
MSDYRVFLLELGVVVIVVIFLLFFFNRIFGFIVSYVIRTITWHRYKAYVHVEAIQLSFLAGRILFKNLRYQSRNESVQILKGNITWRYWLRRTRVRENHRLKQGATNAKLPCRILLELDGVEWFVYNRTPAYDAIVKAAEGRRNEHSPDLAFTKTETNRSSAERNSDNSFKARDTYAALPRDPNAEENEATPFILHLLPVEVAARRGAIILGNTNTPSIVIAQFVEAEMAVDAAESRSKFDLYRMVYNAHFARATIQIKQNIDYKEPLLARASYVVEQAQTGIPRYFVLKRN